MSVPAVEETIADEKMVSGEPTLEFVRFVVPSVVGLLSVQSAAIIDGIFVGNYVGSTALAAVNLALPLLSLFFGICIMLLVGSAVIAGKALGEGNARQASNIFTKSIIVVTIAALLAAFFSRYHTESIAQFLGARGEVLPITISYIKTIIPFLPFMSTTFALGYFAKVDNAPNYALAGLIVAAATNITLDYFFIKVMGWGVVGAAMATGLAYVFSSCFLLARLFMSTKARIRFIMPFGQWRELLRAAYNGFSEFVNEMSGALVMFAINWILMLEIGTDGVAAFTIVNYTIWLSTMVSYGISEALSSLVSVNFGARKSERIRQFVRLGIISSTVFGLLIVLTLQIWPTTIATAFINGSDGGQTLAVTLTIISIIWPMFLLNGLNITLSGYFTGMHCPKESAMIATSRSLVLPLGLLLVLWQILGVNGAFGALPVAEILTGALSLLLYYRNRPEQLIERDSKTPVALTSAAH